MSPYERGLTDGEVRELGFESTRKGWVPVEVAEEHRETGLTRGQWRRFSFVTTRGYAALPDAGLRAFDLAACLGKMVNKEGTFDRLRNVGDAMCVIVRPGVRNRVIALLGVDDPGLRNWRRNVIGWINAGMAHRCESQPRGTITLFFEPQDTCPLCALDERTSDTRTSGHLIPASADISYPPNVPNPGVALRDGKGDAG